MLNNYKTSKQKFQEVLNYSIPKTPKVKYPKKIYKEFNLQKRKAPERGQAIKFLLRVQSPKIKIGGKNE